MANLEALLALQELFSDPARHTRLYLARDASGKPVSPDSPAATCWCFNGGIDKVLGAVITSIEVADTQANRLFAALNSASFACHACGIIHTNDWLGLDAVRQVITLAIARERANPQELPL